jgi:hypothetical protein
MRLTKLAAATGATIWTVPFAVDSIDAGPTGSIYVLGSSGSLTGIFKLDATGTIAWSSALPTELGTGEPPGMGFPHRVAVGADGAVAVQGAAGFARWDTAGSLSWSKAATFSMRHGIGIEPGGAIVVARYEAALERIDGERFAAADGAQLTGLGKIGSQSVGGFDLDASGRLVSSYSGFSNTHVEWGSVANSSNYGTIGSYTWSGVASSVTGDVLSGIRHFDENGWRARRLTSTGTVAWTLTRTMIDVNLGTYVSNLAASAAGQLALVGDYTGFDGKVGWVQVFDP